MNRETAESSTAEAGEGTTEPGKINPIADMDGHTATDAGFEFTGGEYGPETWITCDLDGLLTLEM